MTPFVQCTAEIKTASIFKERYRRIKAHGHKKAIIAVCRMSPDRYLERAFKAGALFCESYLADKLTEHSVLITQIEGLALLRKRDLYFPR